MFRSELRAEGSQGFGKRVGVHGGAHAPPLAGKHEGAARGAAPDVDRQVVAQQRRGSGRRHVDRVKQTGVTGEGLLLTAAAGSMSASRRHPR